MYLVGVSVCRVELVAKALCGKQGFSLHYQRVEPKMLRPHRGLAEFPIAGELLSLWAAI